MRWIVLPLIILTLTGAGAGYGDIDARRDTDPLSLGRSFCAARLGNGDMSALAPYYAPKLQRVLAAAPNPVPWQSQDLHPDSCSAEVMFGQDNIVGVLVRLEYVAGGTRWADTLNFQRTPTSWLLNNVFYDGGGNLRFRLFESGGD